jgi:hypothetical protein
VKRIWKSASLNDRTVRRIGVVLLKIAPAVDRIGKTGSLNEKNGRGVIEDHPWLWKETGT